MRTRSRARSARPPGSPRPSCPTSSASPCNPSERSPQIVRNRRRQPAPRTRPPTNVDARIAAIIDAPLQLGESWLFGATRKEAELLAVFASLTVAQSRAYHARLRSPNSADPLAAKLAQLGSGSK